MKTYISDRGNSDVRIMRYDVGYKTWIESCQYASIDAAASALFAMTYIDHPDRLIDPVLAICDAREIASEALPEGTTGEFDDVDLTFTSD